MIFFISSVGRLFGIGRCLDCKLEGVRYRSVSLFFSNHHWNIIHRNQKSKKFYRQRALNPFKATKRAISSLGPNNPPLFIRLGPIPVQLPLLTPLLHRRHIKILEQRLCLFRCHFKLFRNFLNGPFFPRDSSTGRESDEVFHFGYQQSRPWWFRLRR